MDFLDIWPPRERLYLSGEIAQNAPGHLTGGLSGLES